MHEIYTTPALVIVSLLLVNACANREPLRSRLDDTTGLTVVTMQNPVVLARPTRLAVAARDYAYLGPVEINRRGEREHFLWIGLASTVDHARVDQPPPQAESLALLVDGVPMILPLSEWNSDLDVPPYAGSTPVYASLAARASLDQIRRIAGAQSVQVRIVTASGRALAYRHWDGEWPAWASFAAAAPGNP